MDRSPEEYKAEISEFLKENGIVCGMAGHMIVVYAPMVSILPLPVCSETVEDCEGLSDFCRRAVGSVHGKYVVVPEDLWRSRRNMVEKRLLAHLGRFRRVYARMTEAVRIAEGEYCGFMDRCHTYGRASARYKYGLFDRSGDMVAAASFSSARNFGGRRSYEWVRYASLPDVRVVGGMGKILNAFAEQVRPDDVMSYADLEWTDGSVYRSLGFRKEGERKPVTFLVNPVDWSRRPITAEDTADTVKEAGLIYHRNFGSIKYRKTYERDR